MNKSEKLNFPTFKYGIIAILLFSFSLLFLQSSRFAVSSLPPSLSGFAEFFPGPAWKIASLYAHYLPDRAENYRFFFTALIIGNSMIFIYTVAVFLYINRKIKILFLGELEDIGARNIFFLHLSYALAIYMLFFIKYIDYDNKGIFPSYNMGVSNVGYILDAGSVLALYFWLITILYKVNRRWHLRHGQDLKGI